MSIRQLAVLGLFALASPAAPAATTTTVVDVPTPRGVTQRFLYVRPDLPVATIVEMAGGSGILNIQDDGSMAAGVEQCGPIIRNRQALADRGFAVASVDQTSDGKVRRFIDVQEVVRHVRAVDPVPVWVVGGSAGTASVADLAINLPASDPTGAIFYSPQQLDPTQGALITRPAMVIFHPQDPGQFSGQVFAALTSAPVKERIGLTGGSNTGFCGYHHFVGIDAALVDAIAGLITKYNNSFPPPAPANYGGIWWKSPAGSESGWGINFAHQGDTIFVTWFTYDLAGKAWWLTMTANKTGPGVYSGALFQTRGPAFSAVPFSPAGVVATQVGSGTLSFADGDNGTFAYTVNGVSQTKPITKTVFAAVPTCTFAAQPNLSLATNFQDIWWAAPAGSESGWGVNFTHQGDLIFATWFTYDVDGSPLWLSATLNKTTSGAYTGTLYRGTGPAFNAVPFPPANVAQTPVGTLTVTFVHGNSATYAYTVTPGGGPAVTQSKAIERTVFAPPGTLCHS